MPNTVSLSELFHLLIVIFNSVHFGVTVLVLVVHMFACVQTQCDMYGMLVHVMKCFE